MVQNNLGAPVYVTNSAANPITVAQSDGSGGTATGLPPGRATPSSSVPVAPDTVSLAGINQTFTRSVAGGSGSGNAILVSGVTTAGTVTLTLSGGGTATINAPLGSSIWPFSTTAAALGTAVGGTFTTLFFI